jgi:predicted PurR-regulated permease PerM
MLYYELDYFMSDTVFKRNRVLFSFLIGLVIVCALLYLLREPLLPFFIGVVIAYLLMPVVDWIDKYLPFKGKGNEIQRIIIIIIVFLIVLVLIAAIVYLVLSSILHSFSALLTNAPALISNGLKTLGDWIERVIQPLSPDQQKQAHDIVNNIGGAMGNWLQATFMSGLGFIPSTITFVVGFLTLPFFLILFMANIRVIKKGFYSLFPVEVAYHLRNFISILDSIFGRFIRAQILLGIIMGFLVYVALFFTGIELAPSLALIAGAFQLVPAIGGALAAIVGILITIAVAPDQVLWVSIAYIIINLGIGSILIARIQGKAVNMDGSIVMILIVVGGYLGGIIGMILITPAVAIIFALYKYVLREIKLSRIEAT